MILTALAYFISLLFGFIPLFDSSYFEIQLDNIFDTPRVFANSFKNEKLFLSIGYCLSLLSTVQVSFTWIKFSNSMLDFTKTTCLRCGTYFHKVVKLVFVILAVLTIVLRFFNQGTLAGILVPGLFLFVLVLYVFAHGRFMKTVREMMDSQKKTVRMTRMLSLFKRSKQLTVVSYGLMFCTIVAFPFCERASALNTVPGEFGLGYFVRDLILVALLFKLTTDAWYVHRLVKNVETKGNEDGDPHGEDCTTVVQNEVFVDSLYDTGTV